MAQHTEEWFAQGRRVLARTPEGDGLVAECDREEDATLMAAAPTLLEALELFLADWDGDPQPPRKVRIGRAARSQARGGG